MNAPETWHRLERWVRTQPYAPIAKLQDGKPTPQPQFLAPARAEHIAQVEASIGLSFPAELRDLYLVHDGTNVGCLPEGMWFRDLAAIESDWHAFRQLCEEFPPEHGELSADRRHFDCVYDPKRLPLATREDGPELFLDFRPGTSGTSGQVLYLINECEFAIAADNLAAFLSKWLKLLESGALEFNPECGYPLPCDGRESYELFLGRQ